MDRLSLTLRLREALAAEAFSLHWQPIHRLRDGALVGAEALVRWQDENGVYVPPDEFIPYAETVGLIVPIGAMVLDAAAWQAARWRARGLSLPVSVNLSPQQIVGSDVVAEVRAALGRHGVDPSMLRLELTETAAVTDFPVTRQRLAELRELGVGLSLDDFGTGYSSLRLLRDLAVDDVKVDRSFVQGLDVNGADAAMVRLVVETAHALGLTVTAEGVERPDQLTALAELGCDSVQGFLLGTPVPVADFDLVGDAARALCEPATARAAANAWPAVQPAVQPAAEATGAAVAARPAEPAVTATASPAAVASSSGRRRARSSASSPAAASASWVAMTTTAPASASARNASTTRCRLAASRSLVGSSARTTAAAAASVRASATRCCWPPDSSSTRWFAESARPSSVSAARARAERVDRRHARGQQRHQDVLLGGEERRQPVALRGERDATPGGLGRGRRPAPRRPRRCRRAPLPRPAPRAATTCPRRTAR